MIQRTNPDARFIHYVETIDDSLIQMGKATSGAVSEPAVWHQKLPLP